MDKSISQFREVTNIGGEEYVLLAYPNIRNVKIKTKNFFSNTTGKAPNDGNTYAQKNGEWTKLINIVPLTEEEYENLPYYDDNTLYIIYASK